MASNVHDPKNDFSMFSIQKHTHRGSEKLNAARIKELEWEDMESNERENQSINQYTYQIYIWSILAQRTQYIQFYIYVYN